MTMKFILPALLCVVIAAGAPALLFGMHDPLWLFGLTILVLLIHAGDIKTTADIGITPGGPVKKPAQGGGNGNGPPPEGRTMRW